jgi:outer membrane receptor protein involved in Fe transport
VDADDRFGSHVSPRAALTFFPWEGNALKAIYSEAFRAPSAFEIYYTDPTTQIAGGEDLDPEVVRSVELSIEQRAGTQKAIFGVFRSWWTDMIVTDELTPTELQSAIDDGELEAGTVTAFQAQNVASIDNYGFNAGYEGSLVTGRLRYGASVTQGFTRRNDPTGRDVLAVAAPVFGNARISYHLGGELPTLALASRFVGRRPANSYPDPDFAKPQIELRGTVSGPIPGMPELTYRVTGNYAAQTHSAYVVGPARLANGDRELAPVDRFRAGIGLEYVLPM